jgi:hypothetical protein
MLIPVNRDDQRDALPTHLATPWRGTERTAR